jgi:hypothetical protein
MKITAEIDTAACEHSQNDGSTEYFVLQLHVTPDDGSIPYPVRFRVTEHAYSNQIGGNGNMVLLLNELVKRINKKDE